jgi:hypothetical protein
MMGTILGLQGSCLPEAVGAGGDADVRWRRRRRSQVDSDSREIRLVVMVDAIDPRDGFDPQRASRPSNLGGHRLNDGTSLT